MKGDFKAAAGRYFFDTEFLDRGGAGFGIDFISIGIVSEDNREYYAVHDATNPEEFAVASPWLKENVLDKLPPRSEWQKLEDIRKGVLGFIEPAKTAEFWATNGTYDNYCLCRIFGGMAELRQTLKDEKGIGKVVFRDMHELRRAYGYARIKAQPEETKHIALEDARHDRKEFDWHIGQMLRLVPPRAKRPQP